MKEDGKEEERAALSQRRAALGVSLAELEVERRGIFGSATTTLFAAGSAGVADQMICRFVAFVQQSIR